MRGIIEAVPNVSEGRRLAVIDRLAAVADAFPHARLLHRTSDVDHGRSVLTVAGDPTAVRASMEALVDAALGSIDLSAHRGIHPHIGAVDVVPFVPLAGATMAGCVALAREFAATIADRHRLPVYLYAEAAQRPERRLLPDVRRPRLEGLRALLATSEGTPDFGPARPHPTGGATVVGARAVLIAWNIQLESTDVAVARRIAARIRERDGGLPRVQALGFFLAAESRAQVSMNILDHALTPLWRVFETVARLASEEGVSIHDSELIGLLPQAALDAVADHAGIRGRDEDRRLASAAAWLRLRDFTPDRVLEARLRRLSTDGAEGGEPRSP